MPDTADVRRHGGESKMAQCGATAFLSDVNGRVTNKSDNPPLHIVANTILMATIVHLVHRFLREGRNKSSKRALCVCVRECVLASCDGNRQNDRFYRCRFPDTELEVHAKLLH